MIAGVSGNYLPVGIALFVAAVSGLTLLVEYLKSR